MDYFPSGQIDRDVQMAVYSSSPCSPWLYSKHSVNRFKIQKTTSKMGKRVSSSLTSSGPKESTKSSTHDLGIHSRSSKYCPWCLRRQFLGAVIGTGLSPALTSLASGENSRTQDPIVMLNMIHPPRPDWYEEFYAAILDKMMNSYEAEIAGYKSQLFANLKGKAEKVLEVGIGTGPNLKYYGDSPDIMVIGVDPNRKMEQYAHQAAEIAGIKPSNFMFMQAVAEGLPLNDASVDAVVGTLVLCSVKDVDQALQEVKRVLRPGGLYIFVEHVVAKDRTTLKLLQGILDPLQQTLADGCHLTRSTANNIASAGFTSVDVKHAFLSNFSLISPHVYGIARR